MIPGGENQFYRSVNYNNSYISLQNPMSVSQLIISIVVVEDSRRKKPKC